MVYPNPAVIRSALAASMGADPYAGSNPYAAPMAYPQQQQQQQAAAHLPAPEGHGTVYYSQPSPYGNVPRASAAAYVPFRSYQGLQAAPPPATHMPESEPEPEPATRRVQGRHPHRRGRERGRGAARRGRGGRQD